MTNDDLVHIVSLFTKHQTVMTNMHESMKIMADLVDSLTRRVHALEQVNVMYEEQEAKLLEQDAGNDDGYAFGRHIWNRNDQQDN